MDNVFILLLAWAALGAAMGVTVGLIINRNIPFYIDLLFGGVFGLAGGLVFILVKTGSPMMMGIFITIIGPRLALMIYDKVQREKEKKNTDPE